LISSHFDDRPLSFDVGLHRRMLGVAMGRDPVRRRLIAAATE
jgi:hypothetical protein